MRCSKANPKEVWLEGVAQLRAGAQRVSMAPQTVDTAALSTEAYQHPGLHLWLDRSRHRLALRFCFLAEPHKRGAAREPRWVRCQPSRRALLA